MEKINYLLFQFLVKDEILSKLQLRSLKLPSLGVLTLLA